MKKIMMVFGTRPEVIKLAPLIQIFKTEKNYFQTKVCNTGQHKEMVDSLVRLFNIEVNYDFEVMKTNQTLTGTISKILHSFDKNLINYKPDYIFVLGDTLTAYISTIYAYHNKISVVHVEAGLRAGNLYSPWPEEGYRKMISQLSQIHFAPTTNSKNNLIKENISNEKIFVTGNTVIDALFMTLDYIKNSKDLKEKIKKYFMSEGYVFSDRKIIVVTSHRRENFGDGIKNICKAISKIANEKEELDIVFPVHPNPNIKKLVYDSLNEFKNVFLVKPLSYEKFVYLMKKSYLILSDSGGVQEEAPSLGKPVLVMRDTTERIEAIEYGTVKLVGSLSEIIYSNTIKILEDKDLYNQISTTVNPYGDGDASKRILEIMKNE